MKLRFALDLSDSSHIRVSYTGWKARLALAGMILFGWRRTLRFFQRLPLKGQNSQGLLCWTPANILRKGEWAICYHFDSWDSFIVVRANTDLQLKALTTGGVSFP